MMGPPKVPPYWFWCRMSFVVEKKLVALMYVVADELEGRAMKLIGSRAGDDVDQAAAVHAALRAERGGLNAELADRIREGEGQVGVGHVVVVVAAVEPPHGGVAHATGDGDRDGLVGVFAAGKVAAGSGGGAAREEDQAGHVTTVQRHRPSSSAGRWSA